jgi:hypothetical protein
LFLIMRDGWSARGEAEEQFAPSPKKHQRWLKLFVAFAQEDSGGRPVADWARERYEPERLVQWLTEHGHADTYERIFTTPTRSRWQLLALKTKKRPAGGASRASFAPLRASAGRG